MTGRHAAAAAILLALAMPQAGRAESALDRLRDLAAPEMPAPGELYADDIAADLAQIGAEAGTLFDPGRAGVGPDTAPVRIVMFTGPDCAECAAAEAELAALAERLGIRAAVIDIAADPEDAALMERLSLDMLPSYVMRDRMIRGAMPGMVLEGYLSP